MNSATPTPAKVLSKSQMKKAVRNSNKVRTRNVLFNPFAIEWPVVSRADAAAVLSAITDTMQKFDIPCSLPPAEMARLRAAGTDRAGITAAQRQLRQEAAPLLERRRQHLADCLLGFNAASRALENDCLAAMLVEAETPALDTRMLAPLAAGRRCPAACLHRLRQTLEEHVGIATTVFGLKAAVKEKEHHLHPLYLAICAAAPPLRAQTSEHPPKQIEVVVNSEKKADIQQKTQPDMILDIQDNGADPDLEMDTASPEPEPSAVESSERRVSPVPFDEADFISLSTPVAPAKRPARRAEVRRQVESLMSIDTVGVPNKRRLLLKAAQVMQVTQGNRAEKKAAKLARKREAKGKAKGAQSK